MMQTPKQMIGIVLKGYPRLSETFIVNEIRLLEELGYDLHIFALRDPGEDKVHDSVLKVKAKVTYIPDYFWKSFFAIVGANLRRWRQQPGVYWKWFCFALFRSIRQLSSSTIKRFAQAAYLVERGLPGAYIAHFHAHFSHGPTTVAYFASLLSGINYSFSAHAKDIYLQENNFLREKIQRAQFVVTCTEFNRQHLLRVAGYEAPVFRSYHGIDTELFKPVTERAGKHGVPVILSVGRFVPKKGFPVLLHALHKLRQEGLPFRAYLIGGGELRPKLESLVKALGLRDCVELKGQMSQSELHAYYREADVFALACEVQADGDRDGIPNVLVEAMAMAIPVVSTSISGIPELVQNGVNGLLVEEKNRAALAEAIAKLLNDPQMARRLGAAGRAMVEYEFDSRRNVERIGELLWGALVSRSPHQVSVHAAESTALLRKLTLANGALPSSASFSNDLEFAAADKELEFSKILDSE
jgi:glycosyltransferase involved in cell wall biosynthesis